MSRRTVLRKVESTPVAIEPRGDRGKRRRIQRRVALVLDCFAMGVSLAILYLLIRGACVFFPDACYW